MAMGGRVARTTVVRKQKDEEGPPGPSTTCTFVISHKLMFSSIKNITSQGQSIQHMSLSKAIHIQPKISHACSQRIAALLQWKLLRDICTLFEDVLL